MLAAATFAHLAPGTAEKVKSPTSTEAEEGDFTWYALAC